MIDPHAAFAPWCDVHWDALRRAVERLGLGHLLLHGDTALSNVADLMSLAVARHGATPDRCPACFVQAQNDALTRVEDQISACVEAVRAYAVDLGLLP